MAKTKQTKKTTKRNPVDATMRNVRAMKRRALSLHARVVRLEDALIDLKHRLLGE